MPAPRTALVVGGGIVGLCSALSLQERGFGVTLVDDDPARPPASWGNVGHIAVEQTDPLASLATIRSLPRRLALFGGAASFPPAAAGTWLPFGLRLLRAAAPARFERGRAALSSLLKPALAAWRDCAARIGAPELLKETGHIVAWESAGSAERGREALSRPSMSGVTCHDLSARQWVLLRTAVRRPIPAAVHYEGTASVSDPGAVLTSLAAHFLRNGGIRETGLVSPARLLKADADVVVVAAGVRSARLMEAVGHRVPIIAERGYHIQSTAPAWPDELPPVVFEDRSIVATGFTSGLRVTGFVEFTRPDAPSDPRKWRRLRRHAIELGLPFEDECTTWFGARPTLPDYLPAIGRSSLAPRLVYAFGHQHLGLTLGPITGEVVAAMAAGERPPVDVAPFAVERF